MFRFIFNFFLFGALFFLIWRFFPQAFDTLFAWANGIWDFVASLWDQLMARVDSHSTFKDNNP